MINFNAYNRMITQHKAFLIVLSSNKCIIYWYWSVTFIIMIKNRRKKSDTARTQIFKNIFLVNSLWNFYSGW